MKAITLADGTYSFRSPMSRAAIVATFQNGALVGYTYAGEAQACTDLAAQQLAHQIGYLEGVTFTVLTIGKARAHQLHKLMARAGVPSGEHYGFASAALDQNVYSLADLTEAEARQVWNFLKATHNIAA